MSSKWFDPAPEEQNVVLVDEPIVRRAERWIRACEACKPHEAQMPFDWILDRITSADPTITDYVLVEPARCPRCRGTVFEKTLVEVRDDGGRGDDDGARDLPEPQLTLNSSR